MEGVLESVWWVSLSLGTQVRDLLSRTCSALRPLRHPWLRGLHDAPATKKRPNLMTGIATSVLVVLVVGVFCIPSVAGGQTEQVGQMEAGIREEQAAIESGEGLSFMARAK